MEQIRREAIHFELAVGQWGRGESNQSIPVDAIDLPNTISIEQVRFLVQ